MLQESRSWDGVHRVWGEPHRAWLLVGHGDRSARLAEEILANPQYGIRIDEVVNLEDEALTRIGSRGRHFSRLPLSSVRTRAASAAWDLRSIVASRPIDEVVITLPTQGYDREVQQIVSLCHDAGISVRWLSTEEQGADGDAAASHVASCRRISADREFASHAALRIKRLIDVLGSAVGLILLLPFLLLIGLVIKLSSSGPVLFTQDRSGLRGRPFRLFKFRSMIRDAPAWRDDLQPFNQTDGAAFKIKNDPRVTPVGRFLRRHHVDELPQLWNVLLGHMSLVGPRPLPPEEAYGNEWWQRRRLSVPPGLTCAWQVEGDHTLPFRQWMESDLRYIDNWSIGRDLRLIVATAITVLRGKGW